MFWIKFKKTFKSNYYFSCIIYVGQLRYVVVKKRSKEVEISSYGTLSLPLERRVVGSNKKLREFKKSNTIIGIASEFAHLKLMRVDANLGPFELKKYIQTNVFKFFKYMNDALYLDYRLVFQNLHILPIRKHQKYLQLLAAKKDDLKAGLSALNLLKIKFSIMSIECIAWLRLVQKFLKPLPDIYVLIFFEENKFSIVVAEKNYLIYKNHCRFISDDKSNKSEHVIRMVALMQSLYPSVTFDHYIVMGQQRYIICPDMLQGKFDYFDISLFLKINLNKRNLPYYYAAIGLTL